MPKRTYMVLNDGETYTGLKGCKIVEIDELWEDHPQLDEIVKLIASGDAALITSEGHVVTEFK